MARVVIPSPQDILSQPPPTFLTSVIQLVSLVSYGISVAATAWSSNIGEGHWLLY